MRYRDLTDVQLIELLFREEDRLNAEFLAEAKRRRDTLVPPLADLLKREANYRWGNGRDWAVVHAVHLLGILEATDAVDALLAASRFANKYEFDWIWDALPAAYLRLGPAIAPKLMAHIHKHKKKDPDFLLSEIEGLWNIWEDHPETQARIEAFLLDVGETCGDNVSLRAELMADFAQIGRADLRPLFEGYYDRGEVDLDILPREEYASLLLDPQDNPGFRYDLEAFYSEEEILRRQRQWEEEQVRADERALEDHILDHLDRIPRSAPCPCGSGVVFAKCHLPWAEEAKARYRQALDLRRRAEQTRAAVNTERETEMWLRQHLHARGRLPLFDLIRERCLAVIKDPASQAPRGHLTVHLLQPVLEQVRFSDQKEMNEFFDRLLAYYDALAAQFAEHPRNGQQIH